MSSSNEDCVVSGALYVTLWLSRLFGMAPFRFVSLQNGYRASLSRFYALCGYIFVTLFNTIAGAALLGDVMQNIFDFTWNYAFFCFATIVIFILSSHGSYCAIRRMKNFMKHLKCLEEIKTNVEVKIKDKKIQNIARSALIIIHLCITIQFFFGELIMNIQNKEDDPIRWGYFVLYIHLMMIFLLQIHIVLIFLEVQSSLDVIKNIMDEILSLDVLEDPLSSTISNNIRHLSRAYVTACDVVSKLDHEEGMTVFLLVFYLIIRVLNIGCYLGSRGSPLPSQYRFVFLISWCIMNSLDFLTFIEAFNYATNEVTNIKVRLSKLMYKATDVGHRVPTELDLMFKQLDLNKMTFCPLSLFTLERTLTIRILSGIFTYFLFVIQIQ